VTTEDELPHDVGDTGFRGRSILVTGGSRGIGLATARRFLAAGASVTIGAIDPGRLDAARKSLDGDVHLATVAADVGTPEGCRATVEAALAAFGRLDVLFTNAGNYESAPLEDVAEDLWDRTIDTHVKGTFFCVQAAAPALREVSGCVVTMGSDAGLLGFQGGWAAYCAAMGGVLSLTRQLAVDLAPQVRVNAVAPGPVGTEHLYADLAAASYGGLDQVEDATQAVINSVPLKRIITPEEVAEAVVFLASARSITGAILSVDGGTTIALP
jgi:NAD(P)-dependent dehydrogenase (short-subunit alcohol dehydrogenase family)